MSPPLRQGGRATIRPSANRSFADRLSADGFIAGCPTSWPERAEGKSNGSARRRQMWEGTAPGCPTLVIAAACSERGRASDRVERADRVGSPLPAPCCPLPAPRNLYPATCNLSPHPMTFVPPTSPFSLASLPPIPQTESGRDSPNRESFSFAPPGASCCGRFVLSHPGQLPIPRTARAEDSHHRVDSRKRCIFGVRRVRDLCKYFICSLNACCQIGNAR